MSIGGGIPGLIGRIKRAAKLKGWDQTELARQLKTRQSTTSGWWNGTAAPSAAWLIRLPGVLGVSGHWLLTEEGRMEAPGEKELEPYRIARESAEAEVTSRVREAVVRALEPSAPPAGKRELAAGRLDVKGKRQPPGQGRTQEGTG